MKDDAPSTIGPADPPRLLAAKTDQARLLRLYARQTLPGNPDGVASWYRLRARLDESEPPFLPAGRPWHRTWLLAGMLTAALGMVVLAKAVPLLPTSLPSGHDKATPSTLDSKGSGGAAGSIETDNRGAGGMEGASGERGSGGSA